MDEIPDMCEIITTRMRGCKFTEAIFLRYPPIAPENRPPQ